MYDLLITQGIRIPYCSEACDAAGWHVLHVSLVVVADLLDADVVLRLDVGLGGGIGPSQSHHTSDILEVLLTLNFDLWDK